MNRPSLATAVSRMGFSRLTDVAGRYSVLDLVPPAERCGLYLLHFRTGEVYLGQSVQLCARYAQHATKHADIAQVAFRRVGRTHLDDEERYCIERLEKWGFRLRNLSLVSDRVSAAEFDELVGRDHQRRFIRHGRLNDAGLRVPRLPELRRRYLRTFGEFMARSHAVDALYCLGRYISLGIPLPLQTQAAHWSCCVVGNGRKLRINVFWQEVITIWGPDDEQVRVSVHVARSPLDRHYGGSLRAMERAIEGVRALAHRYAPGGHDQMCLEFDSQKSFAAGLRLKAVAQAIRLFNVRLMRKGGCNWSRFHSPQIVDLALRLARSDSSGGC
jgi:hypothetical protein